MDIRKLQRAIVDGLEDVKGQNIVVFDTEKLSSLFERVIIASGTSNRQTKALAASVRDAVKSLGAPPPRIEGEDNGEWIIVDCGAAVVHLMQPTIREYYHLEEIWGAKPVKVKLDTAPKGLVKASPVVDEEAAPAKKTARKAEAKPLSKTAAKTAAKAAAKAEAEEASAPKKSPARKKAAESVAADAPVAKKAPARKKAAEAAVAAPAPAAKKAPARKGAVTRTAGVKVAAQTAAKAPAKKAAVKTAAPVKTLVVKAPVAVAKQAAEKKAVAAKKAAAQKRAATPKAPKAAAKTGKSAKG